MLDEKGLLTTEAIRDIVLDKHCQAAQLKHYGKTIYDSRYDLVALAERDALLELLEGWIDEIRRDYRMTWETTLRERIAKLRAGK